MAWGDSFSYSALLANCKFYSNSICIEGGTGHVAGTKKHKYAEKVLTRYQRRYGSRGLEVEEVYDVNGGSKRTKGSIILDVVDEKFKTTYDYKFTTKKTRQISKSRTTKIKEQSGMKRIVEVKPQMSKVTKRKR
jgi:hypothetical protein